MSDKDFLDLDPFRPPDVPATGPPGWNPSFSASVLETAPTFASLSSANRNQQALDDIFSAPVANFNDTQKQPEPKQPSLDDIRSLFGGEPKTEQKPPEVSPVYSDFNPFGQEMDPAATVDAGFTFDVEEDKTKNDPFADQTNLFGQGGFGEKTMSTQTPVASGTTERVSFGSSVVVIPANVKPIRTPSNDVFQLSGMEDEEAAPVFDPFGTSKAAEKKQEENVFDPFGGESGRVQEQEKPLDISLLRNELMKATQERRIDDLVDLTSVADSGKVSADVGDKEVKSSGKIEDQRQVPTSDQSVRDQGIYDNGVAEARPDLSITKRDEFQFFGASETSKQKSSNEKADEFQFFGGSETSKQESSNGKKDEFQFFGASETSKQKSSNEKADEFQFFGGSETSKQESSNGKKDEFQFFGASDTSKQESNTEKKDEFEFFGASDTSKQESSSEKKDEFQFFGGSETSKQESYTEKKDEFQFFDASDTSKQESNNEKVDEFQFFDASATSKQEADSVQQERPLGGATPQEGSPVRFDSRRPLTNTDEEQVKPPVAELHEAATHQGRDTKVTDHMPKSHQESPEPKVTNHKDDSQPQVSPEAQDGDFQFFGAESNQMPAPNSNSSSKEPDFIPFNPVFPDEPTDVTPGSAQEIPKETTEFQFFGASTEPPKEEKPAKSTEATPPQLEEKTATLAPEQRRQSTDDDGFRFFETSASTEHAPDDAPFDPFGTISGWKSAPQFPTLISEQHSAPGSPKSPVTKRKSEKASRRRASDELAKSDTRESKPNRFIPRSELELALYEGLTPPDEVDESPFFQRIQVPTPFVPFEKTDAAIELASFCKSVLGYTPTYAGGAKNPDTPMPALAKVLKTHQKGKENMFA